MRSRRMDPSVASANTSPFGPKAGDLSSWYVEPGHFAISRCARSYTSVGLGGAGPQPDTYVSPAASTVTSHMFPPVKDEESGENASTLWPLGSMYRTLPCDFALYPAVIVNGFGRAGAPAAAALGCPPAGAAASAAQPAPRTATPATTAAAARRLVIFSMIPPSVPKVVMDAR